MHFPPGDAASDWASPPGGELRAPCGRGASAAQQAYHLLARGYVAHAGRVPSVAASRSSSAVNPRGKNSRYTTRSAKRRWRGSRAAATGPSARSQPAACCASRSSTGGCEPRSSRSRRRELPALAPRRPPWRRRPGLGKVAAPSAGSESEVASLAKHPSRNKKRSNPNVAKSHGRPHRSCTAPRRRGLAREEGHDGARANHGSAP